MRFPSPAELSCTQYNLTLSKEKYKHLKKLPHQLFHFFSHTVSFLFLKSVPIKRMGGVEKTRMLILIVCLANVKNLDWKNDQH